MTALKPVRAEQVRRPERKQNQTVPHCGPVLPICLSLRPVGSIHVIIETVLIGPNNNIDKTQSSYTIIRDTIKLL